MSELTASTACFLAVLRALTAHLDAHPHLPVVNVSGIGARYGTTTDLQLSAGLHADELPGVVAWARSLGLTEVHVRRFPPSSAGMARCHVHARGVLGGHPVDVWDSVHALDLVADELPENGPVDLDELVQVAADTAARVASDAVLAGAR